MRRFHSCGSTWLLRSTPSLASCERLSKQPLLSTTGHLPRLLQLLQLGTSRLHRHWWLRFAHKRTQSCSNSSRYVVAAAGSVVVWFACGSVCDGSHWRSPSPVLLHPLHRIMHGFVLLWRTHSAQQTPARRRPWMTFAPFEPPSSASKPCSLTPSRHRLRAQAAAPRPREQAARWQQQKEEEEEQAEAGLVMGVTSDHVMNARWTLSEAAPQQVATCPAMSPLVTRSPNAAATSCVLAFRSQRAATSYHRCNAASRGNTAAEWAQRGAQQSCDVGTLNTAAVID